MLTPTSCRVARAALGWGRKTLSYKSGVSIACIDKFETGDHKATVRTRRLIREAFEREGIIIGNCTISWRGNDSV